MRPKYEALRMAKYGYNPCWPPSLRERSLRLQAGIKALPEDATKADCTKILVECQGSATFIIVNSWWNTPEMDEFPFKKVKA